MDEARGVFEYFPANQREILAGYYIGPAVSAMIGADIQKKGHLTVAGVTHLFFE